MDIGQAALLAGAGVITGAVNAVAGGGSLMTFPALLLAGLPPVQASVTNAVSVPFGYIGGVVGTRKDIKGQTALKAMVPAAIAGAAIGAWLLLNTPAKAFDWIAPVLVLIATIVMAGQDWLKKKMRHPEDQAGWIKVAAIFGIGLYGGYFIAAIGVIIMAILGLVMRDEIRRVVGTKNVLQLSIGATAMVSFAIFGNVAWWAVAALVPGTLVGGFIGGHYGRRLNAKTVKWIVVCFGFVVSALLFARAI